MASCTENPNYANSIELSQFDLFKCLNNAKRFALDIGGSLVKLAYYTKVPTKRALIVENIENEEDSKIYEVSEHDEMCDHLKFIKFETQYMETCINFIRDNLIYSKELMQDKIIKVTGGGAFKYTELIRRKLGVEVDKEDEMECLIKGCNFLFKNIPDEVFLYRYHLEPEFIFPKLDLDSIFPYLLVNIGSGVSLIKVESETKFERVGGSSMGGGTFWGLGYVLTKAKTFDELLNLAAIGDHRNVDLLVKDIYGGAYSALGLPSDLIASSFGKAAMCAQEKDSCLFRDADMAKSILVGISNDIGQIACLTAQLHQLTKIYFGGYFFRGHPCTMHTMTFAINYWSKGDIQAMFLRHEGYLGAIGAFLKGAEEQDSERYCWSENYAGTSISLSDRTRTFSDCNDSSSSVQFQTFDLDRFTKPLVSFPLLLNACTYVPDTVDLNLDEAARNYWLQSFQDATEKLAERAVLSQSNKLDAEERAKRFKDKYISRLNDLKLNSCAYGSLTVRSLLDAREHCLQFFHFVDPYALQKQQENENALRLWSERISAISKLPTRERWLDLTHGLLAGNVFDWGAKEIVTLLETNTFGFQHALQKLPARPWLFDNFDQWLDRLTSSPPHNCAIIFVDNSGIDIVLGVFPFARELLKNGVKVILCANSQPVLNDVTYNELTILTKRLATMCPIVEGALADGALFVMESGQASPCLDLRFVDYDLSDKIKKLKVDLVILEGMGRCIHTNFNAVFSCDVLKAAVIKNQWLAQTLGGNMFDCVFKFEQRKSI